VIVCFGSVNLDFVVEVERLPAPGETVIGPGFRTLPGGKGANQALAARRAGAQVELVGCVGQDAFAEAALVELGRAGVGLGHLVRSAAAPTGCAFIAVDRAGENQIVVAAGANRLLRADAVPERLLGPATTLLLQREVAAQESWALALRAGRLGAATILNVAPAGAVPEEVLRALAWIVVNENEARLLGRAAGIADTDTAEAASRLAQTLGVGIVVTLGAAGMVAARNGERWRIPAMDIVPVDTVGAGDACVGAFAAALDRGLPVAEALRWGSVAGGLACLTPGAQTSLPREAEIRAALGRLGRVETDRDGR
jgi:ribokinase